MDTFEALELAADRGCILRILHLDGSALYWVENHVFISKPFERLEDLVQLIRLLPRLSVYGSC